MSTSYTTPPSSAYTTILTHCTLKGVQMFALLTPPVLILTALRTKSLSPSRFLRTNAVSTFAAGGAFGALSAVGRVNGMGMDQAGQEDRAERIRANAGQRRTDDYCVIGGVLGALVTTTIFLRRVPLPSSVAGGAALGVAGGVLAHVATSVREGKSVGAEMMVEELKSVKEKT